MFTYLCCRTLSPMEVCFWPVRAQSPPGGSTVSYPHAGGGSAIKETKKLKILLIWPNFIKIPKSKGFASLFTVLSPFILNKGAILQQPRVHFWASAEHKERGHNNTNVSEIMGYAIVIHQLEACHSPQQTLISWGSAKSLAHGRILTSSAKWFVMWWNFCCPGETQCNWSWHGETQHQSLNSGGNVRRIMKPDNEDVLSSRTN